MTFKNSILRLLTASLVAVLVAVTSGFTLIIHTCKTCNELSMVAEFISLHEGDNENCCCKSETQDCCHDICTIQEDCCKTTVEQVKLINYIPSDQVKITPDLHFIAEINCEISLNAEVHDSFRQCDNSEKYGSRNLVTTYRQLII